MYNGFRVSGPKGQIRLAKYVRYRDSKDGKQYWELKGFLGVDHLTGRDVKVSRRLDGDGGKLKTKKDAQDEFARLRMEFKEDKTKTEKKITSITFYEVYNEWLEERYKDSVRSSTLSKTMGWFDKYILKELGSLRLDKITIDVCDKAINEWTKGDLEDFKQLTQLATRVLDFAVHKRYMKDNPMSKSYIPTLRKSEPKREYLTKDELLVFLEQTKKYGDGVRWYALFRLIAYTGARKGEVLALKWNDLDEVNKTIRFNKTLAKTPNGVEVSDSTKTGKSRTVSIDEETIQVLKEYRNSKSKMMFPAEKSNKYMHPDLVTTAMRRIIKKTNVNQSVTPHSLRHTHASLLFEAGLSIKDVQYRLGHSDSEITMQIYTHVSSARSRSAVDMFTEFLDK